MQIKQFCTTDTKQLLNRVKINEEENEDCFAAAFYQFVPRSEEGLWEHCQFAEPFHTAELPFPWSFSIFLEFCGQGGSLWGINSPAMLHKHSLLPALCSAAALNQSFLQGAALGLRSIFSFTCWVFWGFLSYFPIFREFIPGKSVWNNFSLPEFVMPWTGELKSIFWGLCCQWPQWPNFCGTSRTGVIQDSVNWQSFQKSIRKFQNFLLKYIPG